MYINGQMQRKYLRSHAVQGIQCLMISVGGILFTQDSNIISHSITLYTKCSLREWIERRVVHHDNVSYFDMDHEFCVFCIFAFYKHHQQFSTLQINVILSRTGRLRISDSYRNDMNLYSLWNYIYGKNQNCMLLACNYSSQKSC